jgi:hypothetical protein
MQRRVVTKWTNVLEVRTASITRALMEPVRTSETSVNFKVTTRRCIAEDFKFHTRRRENLNSYEILLHGFNKVLTIKHHNGASYDF